MKFWPRRYWIRIAMALALGTLLAQRAIPAPPAAEPVAVSAGGAGTAPADYARIHTFLQAHCIECHGPTKQKGDLALHVYKDVKSIVKDRKVWEKVLEKVRGGEMPPKKKKPRPDPVETEAFARTIEGVFYEADKNAKPDPGQVTIRRLNRTEYNNTIRDLVGVDFKPAEDFPSDDIGQGFDNIGDVLSISPVLMERYLAAADAVMRRAIPDQLPKPMVHRVGPLFLKPNLRPRDFPGLKFRPIVDTRKLRTSYALPGEGEHLLRVKAWYERPDGDWGEGDEPAAKLGLWVDGKLVQSFDVLAGEKSPDLCETKLNLKTGEHQFAISFLNPGGEDSGRALRVGTFEIHGPADTRPASQIMLLACDPNLPEHERTRAVLRRFAARAYRRPVSSEEVERIAQLADQVQAQGGKWESAIQFAMEGVLISPKFLFRVELDDRPDSSGQHAIGDYPLASRLSYFLWSTMPDAELFDLAAKGKLHEDAVLEQQVRRMLADPKSHALVDNFAMQWLQIRRLKTFAPDTGMFPDFNEQLRQAMFTETSMFVDAVFREDRSIIDLIDGDFTFLNERLARHYEIADTNGNPAWDKEIAPKGQPIRGEGFVRVHLADRNRGGVLTQASVLSVTSNPTRTSPVKRGKFVLEQILGVPPPPPPPNVPQLPESATAVASGSLRHRMEQHRADPNCANCHEHMDGIGFAFENFNAVGKFRAKDAGFEIDPSGTMPDGKAFRGPAELKKMLSGQKSLFSRCLTKKLLTYALGRGVEYYDQPTVEAIVSALSRNDYKFSTLVVGIAKSDPFRQRRGKEQSQ
ncbi:MAG TPA: DUF1592 domain-containing protein [Tepidisphaeraceae bacterium]|nr:DUF1592 domain-containing protein [Tepidisphaeraceae bacterium]